MKCYSCGNNIEEDIVRCPYCKAIQPNRFAANGNGNIPRGNLNPFDEFQHYNESRKAKYNMSCMVGFILACAGWFLGGIGDIVVGLPIAGVVLCAIGLGQIKPEEQGKIFAKIGIVIGAVRIFLNVILIIISFLELLNDGSINGFEDVFYEIEQL